MDGINNPILLGNPFYEREEYQNHFNLFNYDLSLPTAEEADKLYFHPKDGWELLHKNNGFEPDEVTKITDPLLNRVGPYFMLYNRYTGKLRVLASFDGIGANDNIVTTLKFKALQQVHRTWSIMVYSIITGKPHSRLTVKQTSLKSWKPLKLLSTEDSSVRIFR